MKPDFLKSGGLLPTIIQNAQTMQVLMLGYMNEEAYARTLAEGYVIFFSRSKNRLWMKGETTGNKLKVVDISNDCDNDTLLIKAVPYGPTCHTGSVTCFGDTSAKGFLYRLEAVIQERIESNNESSYTNRLFRKGVNKIAQKVGEEAVELVIEAMDNNIDLFKSEAADLLYHFLLLLRSKDVELAEVEKVLMSR